jgi:hypothetical protein
MTLVATVIVVTDQTACYKTESIRKLNSKNLELVRTVI